MDEKKIVKWSRDASSHFSSILEYLFEQSPSAADIVGNAISDEIEKLRLRSLALAPDRFKKNNDTGKYKASIVYSYRISYYVSEDEIVILRIRHTSREPLDY